jgi:hypothetical protein
LTCELDLLNIPENFLAMKLAGQITRVKSHRDMHGKMYLDPILQHAPTSAKGSSPVTKTTTVTAAVTTQATGNALDDGYLKKGDYYYSVSAAGIKGRLDARAVAGVTSTDGTEKVTLTITSADSNSKRFEIFRGDSASPTTHKKIGEVAGVASSATATWVDNGEYLPVACSKGALVNDMALPDGTSLFMARQLFPITRFALPIYAFNHPAIWMAGVCFQLRAPRFQLLFENIGRA